MSDIESIKRDQNSIYGNYDLASYFREINKIPLLDPQVQKDLLTEHNVYMTISDLYKKIIIGQYYDLMEKIAKKYSNNNGNYDFLMAKQIYKLNKLLDENKFSFDSNEILKTLEMAIKSDIFTNKPINYREYKVSKIDEKLLYKTYEEFILNENERKKLKNKIAEHNLRLIIPIAKKYFNVNRDFILDIIQEGNLGLLHAIDSFDPTMGCALSTYAVHWINQYITRYIDSKNRLIRLPVYLQQKVYRCSIIINEYKNIHGIEPSDEYLKEKLDIDSENLRLIRECMTNSYHTSLNVPIGEDEDDEFGDMIKDEKSNVETTVFNDQLHSNIIEILTNCEPSQAAIITLRFGIILDKPLVVERKNLILILTKDIVDENNITDYLFEKKMRKILNKINSNDNIRLKVVTLDGRRLTLEEVAKVFDITRERIRQIEASSIDKLRKSLSNKMQLKDYLY